MQHQDILFNPSERPGWGYKVLNNSNLCVCFIFSTCRYAARFDCGNTYEMSVALLTKPTLDKKYILDEFNFGPVLTQQWAPRNWHKVYIKDNYVQSQYHEVMITLFFSIIETSAVDPDHTL